MTLAAGCPRCASPVTGEGEDWSCQDHGGIVPLWRPAKAGYAQFWRTVKHNFSRMRMRLIFR